MSATKVYTRRNPSTTREGSPHTAWGNPAGALVDLSFKEALIAAGYGFHVTVGALTTPIQGGGAGTTIDVGQPELCIDVPSGTAIMPILIAVEIEMAADTDGEVSEILIAVDRTQVHSAHGTSTAETAFNLRSDNPTTSLCTIQSAATVNHTTATPTLGLELARKQAKANVVTAGITQGIMDLVYEPKHPPIIVGPAILFVFYGGDTAVNGFIQAQWIEMPEALNSLWGGS